MKGLEDGVFFTTNGDDSQAEGFGSEQIELRIPLEKLQLDDVFGNEAHVRIPTQKSNEIVDVKDFLIESSKKESKEDSTKENPEKDDTDDKIEKESQSKHHLTLLSSDNKDDTFINKGFLSKNMAEEETKKPTEEKKVDKVEEAPMAADSTPTEDPMVVLSAKMDKIIELLSVNKVEEPVEVAKEDEDKDKDKDKSQTRTTTGDEPRRSVVSNIRNVIKQMQVHDGSLQKYSGSL